MSVLTEKQLAAQLTTWKRKLVKENPAYYAVKTDLPYSGSDTITVDKDAFRVRHCRSDLEARQVLAESQDPEAKAVLLFNIPHDKLGVDLVCRFAARRLLSIDPAATLKALYAAKTVDPRITRNRELVEALVEKAASGQGIVTPAGVLEADFAWSILLGREDLKNDRPDLIRILEMSLEDALWTPIDTLSDSLKREFFRWVGERSGKAVEMVSAAVVDQKTAPGLLMPIGLCLGSLFSDVKDGLENLRTQARTRMESYLAGQVIDTASASVWHQNALALLGGLSPSQLRALGGNVDDLLKALKADELAVSTPLSRRGLDERFAILSEAILSFLRRKDLNGLPEMRAAMANIESHHLAKLEDFQGRVQQAQMVVRLAVWTKGEPAAGANRSLKSLSKNYLDDSSYADQALMEIADVSESSSMGKACAKVRQLASTKRIEEQRRFAEAAAAWFQESTHEEVPGVEQVIKTFVAPLASKAPVLLLVMDGMSCPVFNELMEDLRLRGWYAIACPNQPHTVLAALPSVTAISRKALFHGKIDHTDSRTEGVAFRDHPALAGVSQKKKPKLFLKGDLSEPGSAGLSPEVVNALADQNQQVVGILLNVIDDQLSGSEQLRVRWKIATIRHLAEILEQAAESQRTVILTSDHGNIIELNQSRKLGEGSGTADRYRFGEGLLDPENEIHVSGQRIEQATGKPSVIAAATERIRYTSKKTGYHGGCSDREMVVPIAVLQSGMVEEQPEGWDFVERAVPDWWCILEQPVPAERPEPTITKPVRPRKKKKADEEQGIMELPLQLDTDDIEDAGWIPLLLSCTVFKEQWKGLGHTSPKQSDVRAFLDILHRHGGVVPAAILSRELGFSPMRLRGMLAQLKRLFNVDGYGILSEEQETGRIAFDLPLARKQFDMERGS